MKSEKFKNAYEAIVEVFETKDELRLNRLILRKYLNQLWIHCQEIIKTA